MRNLASVCTISETFPLEGKDKVHGIRMAENAYEAMVSKDIQKGDLVAFIQEGALLPETPTWEFLRNLKCYKESEKAFLIKVKKFKEIKSWGLVLKLNEIGLDEKQVSKLKAGDDITELLNIRKYETEEDASPKEVKKPNWVKWCMSHRLTRWIGKIYLNSHSKKVDSFPSEFISKSDETTIQNHKAVIEKFADTECYVTAKMEGQSVTVLINPKTNKFTVCSRNNAYLKDDGSLFWQAAKKYEIKKALEEWKLRTGEYLIIQAEQCGPGIQNNIYNFNDLKWFVYAMKIYNPVTKACCQLSWDDVETACGLIGVPTVPFIGKYKTSEIMPDIKTVEEFAEKKYWTCKGGNYDFNCEPDGKLWKNYFQHEGVVIRSLNYDKDANIGFSVKVKNIDYASKTLSEIAKVASEVL